MSTQTGQKPTVPEVMPLVNALYSGEHECTKGTGIVGGHLHVLLDDGNVEDYFAENCLDLAKKDQCTTCIELAELIVRMSMTQRLRLYREHIV